MDGCTLCPRNCRVDRKKNKGYCREGETVRVARAALHFWEEPCISGTCGSGTVFFSGCPLKCVFCQNHELAQSRTGWEVDAERLAEIFLMLQEAGAANINLVTPTHFVPQIAEALRLAKDEGLALPVVYNTGSYENIGTLKMLEGLVDIYLPDLKFFSPEISGKYAHAPDYFEKASAAIAEMVRQTGPAVYEGGVSGKAVEEGLLMKRGTIVRHMVLPGCTKDSRAVLKYLWETYRDTVTVSIMNQYTPMLSTGQLDEYPELTRPVTAREYDRVVDYALSLGMENAFIQEGETDKSSFIPAFDGEGVL